MCAAGPWAVLVLVCILQRKRASAYSKHWACTRKAFVWVKITCHNQRWNTGKSSVNKKKRRVTLPTPFGFSEPSRTGQILLLLTYIFYQFQQELRNLMDFNRSNVNTLWSIYDCSSSQNASDGNGKQQFSNRRVFLLQLLVESEKHRKSRQCYLVKQTPKHAVLSVKLKHRSTETIKWGLICILLYAVFVCPQPV